MPTCTATEFDGFLLSLEEIVPRTAADIAALIEHFAGDVRADVSRVGVTGSSMGGWVTFYAAAHNPWVSAAAPVISSPGFAELWELVAVETARHLARLRDIDPLAWFIDKFRPAR